MKVIVLGAASTGKSTLFGGLQKAFSCAQLESSDGQVRIERLKGVVPEAKMDIWNYVISNEESRDATVVLKELATNLYFEGAAGAIVLYSASDAASLQHARICMDFFIQEEALKRSMPLVVLLVGDKTGLERQVTPAQMDALVEEYQDTVKLSHVELGAHSEENVVILVNILARSLGVVSDVGMNIEKSGLAVDVEKSNVGMNIGKSDIGMDIEKNGLGKDVEKSNVNIEKNDLGVDVEKSGFEDWTDVSLDAGQLEDISVYDSSNAHKAAEFASQSSQSQFVDHALFATPAPADSFPPVLADSHSLVEPVKSAATVQTKLPPPPSRATTKRQLPPPPVLSNVKKDEEINASVVSNERSLLVPTGHVLSIPVISNRVDTEDDQLSRQQNPSSASSLSLSSSFSGTMSALRSFKDEMLEFDVSNNDYACCTVTLKPQQSVVAPSSTQILFMSTDVNVSSLSDGKSRSGALLSVIEQALKRKKMFKQYDNRTFSQFKQICFYQPRITGQMVKLDLSEYPGGLFVREAHLICASVDTVFMPEQKILGLRVVSKPLTLVRVSGTGAAVVQANGAIVSRKLKDTVTELIMSPAALIGFSSSVTLKFEIFQNKIKVAGPGVVLIQSRPVNIECLADAAEQAVNAEERMEFINQFDQNQNQQAHMYHQVAQQQQQQRTTVEEEEHPAATPEVHTRTPPPPPPLALLGQRVVETDKMTVETPAMNEEEENTECVEAQKQL